MKSHDQKSRPTFPALLAALLAGASLFCANPNALAQPVSITNSFPTGGNTTAFAGSGSVASWIYWYGLSYNNTPVTNDVTMDAGGDTNSGSLQVYGGFGSSGDQIVFFGTFDNQYGYDFTQTIDATGYTNISFDIHVLPGQATDANGDFGTIQTGLLANANGGGTFYGNGLTIPASATNGWVHLVQPIDPTDPNLGAEAGVDFKYTSYSGYPQFPFTFWIDNVVVEAKNIPTPPPTLSSQFPQPQLGLNCIATTPNQPYNRYQLCTVNDTGYSFAGQSSVTYSWNIAAFPTNTLYAFQQHFFIVNGAPGQYDQAADYNLADCIFITVQQAAANGGVLNFRYKTNEPSGNGMYFNTLLPNDPANTNLWPVQPVASITTPSVVGTWSVTFDDSTNVTISGPGGVTTNFVLDAASAALFADPATLILGGQPNDATGYGQGVVYSSFSVTGSASPFTDNFATDTNLDPTLWKNLSNDTNGAVLVPPGSAFWLDWSLPDVGFSLQGAANLASPDWQLIAPTLSIANQGVRQSLLSVTNLPSPSQGFFRLSKPVFSQLQVLLPGETAAPGTPTGKTGTPTPFSLGSSGGIYTFTVNAVDANYFPVTSVNDTIAITSSDPSAVLPLNAALVNGTGQFTLILGSEGQTTVTATDVSNSNIAPVTSSQVTVGP